MSTTTPKLISSLFKPIVDFFGDITTPSVDIGKITQDPAYPNDPTKKSRVQCFDGSLELDMDIKGYWSDNPLDTVYVQFGRELLKDLVDARHEIILKTEELIAEALGLIKTVIGG